MLILYIIVEEQKGLFMIAKKVCFICQEFNSWIQFRSAGKILIKLYKE